MLKKRFFGDTLVEVMFAVGVFSLVAISVVSVMNGSASKIQSSVEISMTRNEIDTQAEALRFLQTAYISEKTLPDDKKVYSDIWNNIKKRSITDTKNANAVAEYAPKTCSEIYSNKSGEAFLHGFILNYRNLYTKDGQRAANVLLLPGDVSFNETKVYPRLVFGNKDELYEEGMSASTKMTAAEGLYIVGVKEQGKSGINEQGAYYDFYIRSCWQTADSDNPTLTSTVIRLYDPDIAVTDRN